MIPLRRLRDMKYIGFKHQRENKQNSDNKDNHNVKLNLYILLNSLNILTLIFTEYKEHYRNLYKFYDNDPLRRLIQCFNVHVSEYIQIELMVFNIDQSKIHINSNDIYIIK